MRLNKWTLPYWIFLLISLIGFTVLWIVPFPIFLSVKTLIIFKSSISISIIGLISICLLSIRFWSKN
jgi:hypothetical protein